ncbi:MAG: hypothetical protein V1702_02930 [Candidatus Woesearchaeota archaeon]
MVGVAVIPEKLEEFDDISNVTPDKTYERGVARGMRVADSIHRMVCEVRDTYKRANLPLEDAGLAGGISRARAASMVLGRLYLTRHGEVNYVKLASHVGGHDPSKLSEVIAFVERHNDFLEMNNCDRVDDTHNPFGRKHPERKRVQSLRYLEMPTPEPVVCSISFRSSSDLEELVKDPHVKIERGIIAAQITGPGVSDYLRTLESKGYSVSRCK